MEREDWNVKYYLEGEGKTHAGSTVACTQSSAHEDQSLCNADLTRRPNIRWNAKQRPKKLGPDQKVRKKNL